MQVSGAISVFFFGCLGGVAIELLRWWKLRESLEFPAYTKKPIYWGLTLAMIVVGGLVAIAYGTGRTSVIMAMNIGASAPAIIGAFATPPKSVKIKGGNRNLAGDGPARSSIRSFLAFGSS